MDTIRIENLVIKIIGREGNYYKVSINEEAEVILNDEELSNLKEIKNEKEALKYLIRVLLRDLEGALVHNNYVVEPSYMLENLRRLLKMAGLY